MMEVKQERGNKLLGRKEVLAEGKYGSNPGFAEVTKKLSEHFKASEELVVVNKIESHYGTNRFLIDAYIYETADAMKRLAIKKKEKKK